MGAIIPKCDFSQLTKLDDLFLHYQVHQEEAKANNTAISLADFLYIHFVSGDEHEHNNSENHQKLPLQTISSGAVLYCHAPTLENTLPIFPSKVFHKIEETSIKKDIITALFRPPIFC